MNSWFLTKISSKDKIFVLMLWFDEFCFCYRIGTMVEVHSGPLAAQTEDPETISTGEVKNNSVDLVEGALTLTGKNLSILSHYEKMWFFFGIFLNFGAKIQIIETFLAIFKHFFAQMMLIFILNQMKILWIPGFWKKNLVKRQDFLLFCCVFTSFSTF